MADKNPSYSSFWANWNEMDAAQRRHDGAQMLAFSRGASLLGMVEILENAPLPFKKAAWEQWTQDADLSGYLLGDVLALQDTETPAISYAIVKAWLRQADLSRCNDAQISKMSASLTVFEDRVSLWGRWMDCTDLRVYKLPEVIALMGKMLDNLPVKMFEKWVEQMGVGAARREMHTASMKTKDAAEKLGAGVVEAWNKVW
jgi:hypothetical protein